MFTHIFNVRKIILAKVTKSFRIDEELWNQFVATCETLDRKITDVIEEIFRDFLNEAPAKPEFDYDEALKRHRNLLLELRKLRGDMDKTSGKGTFRMLRDRYDELGGKDDLSNFDEIRALMFRNPPDVGKEALVFFWDYARKYESFLELGNRLAELGKGNLPSTPTGNEIEETEVGNNESETEEK